MADRYFDLRTAGVVRSGGQEVYVPRGGKLPDLDKGEAERLEAAGITLYDTEQPRTPPVVAPNPLDAVPEINRIPTSVALAVNPELDDEGNPVGPVPEANVGPTPVALLAQAEADEGPKATPRARPAKS